MFDVGFFELLLIGVVTLLVVGPERLPKVARTAGLWLGKARAMVASVKADIDRELAAEELKKALAKQAEIPELYDIMEETESAVEALAKSSADQTGKANTRDSASPPQAESISHEKPETEPAPKPPV